MQNEKLVKIIVADDHPIIFEGIRAMVQDEQNIQICDFVEQLHLISDSLQKHQPDLLLLDINFNGKSSLSEIAAFRANHPNLKIMMFSSYDNDSVLRESMKLGVNGFLNKHISREGFVRAVKSVMEKGLYFSPLFKLNNPESTEDKIEIDFFDELRKLSDREKTIIRYIVRGFENVTIAENLFISLHTVRTHRRNIFNKLKIHSATELTKLVMSSRILG
ncbi:MAG: LuxR C-terminal-related transcriptional regulator [Saprospiraceae bacterium]